MAYTLITLVAQVVETAIYRVIYPMFCEYSTDIAKLGRIYKCATIIILSIEAPIAFFLLFNSRFFVGLLLSHKWMPMAPILAVLAPSQIMNKYSTFGMEVLRATKRDRWLMVIYVASAVTLTFFGVVLTRMYGLYGMVAAFYISIGAVLMVISLSKIIRNDLIDLTWKMAVVYTASFILAAIPALLLDVLGLAAHVAAIAMVLLSWALFFKLYWHSVARPALKDME
jgi:O-antigen/teichoic acid export membrane protein